jgi:GNAT superfamily N-acetyltransferase
MLDNWSREALMHEVLEAPRRALGQAPGMRVIARPGWWQLITPAFKHGSSNEVALAVLEPRDADAVIDRTIAEYRRLGVRFRWTVGPDSRPLDLGERLEQRGLVRREMRGMVRECAGMPLAEVDPRVSVELVDAAGEPEFTHVLAQGWEMDPAPLAPYHVSVLRDRSRRTQLFLARYDGRPAGAATASSSGRTSHLVGGVILPEFRGRGLYRTLVQRRLTAAAERGIEIATTHAGAMSGPVLERLGFLTVCTFSTYAYTPS